MVPESVKRVVRPLLGRARPLPGSTKYEGELAYWQSQWEQSGHQFGCAWYEELMLAMAGEPDASFLADKIVADFGCGPRDTLGWATPARIRIGIDVLADAYSRFNISSHSMCFVCSTEEYIPLPSSYVDVLFTINAMDHTSNFPAMCAELIRVLKPGGRLVGSFNLEEPSSTCEPQTLTESMIESCLLEHLETTSYRIAAIGPEGDFYRHFSDDTPAPTEGPRFLWVRANKP